MAHDESIRLVAVLDRPKHSRDHALRQDPTLKRAQHRYGLLCLRRLAARLIYSIFLARGYLSTRTHSTVRLIKPTLPLKSIRSASGRETSTFLYSPSFSA